MNFKNYSHEISCKFYCRKVHLRSSGVQKKLRYKLWSFLPFFFSGPCGMLPKELYLSELCRSENGLIAIYVCANTYGRGLSYAPENWPCPGDKWQWKVRRRSSEKG